MELAEPACRNRGRLAGMEERQRRSHRPELEVQRVVEHLDGAPSGLEAPGHDPSDAPALLGQLSGTRQVDARQLEQRDVVVAGVDVLGGGADQALEQGRAENRLVAAHRIRQADRRRIRVGGDEAPRVRLAEAGSHEDVLDETSQPLVA